MDIKNSLKSEATEKAFLALLNGAPCQFGCPASEIEHCLEQAELLFPQHRKCIVRNWKWIDIEGTEADVKSAANSELQLTFLFSSNVNDVSGSRGYDWIRTTMLHRFIEPALFVTKNSIYLLVGEGQYYSVSVKTAYKLFMRK